jgi:hypothetical protein
MSNSTYLTRSVSFDAQSWSESNHPVPLLNHSGCKRSKQSTTTSHLHPRDGHVRGWREGARWRGHRETGNRGKETDRMVRVRVPTLALLGDGDEARCCGDVSCQDACLLACWFPEEPPPLLPCWWMRGGAAEFRDGGGGRVRNTGIGLLGFKLLGPGLGTNGLGRNNSKALYRTNSKNTVFLKRVMLPNV